MLVEVISGVNFISGGSSTELTPTDCMESCQAIKECRGVQFSILDNKCKKINRPLCLLNTIEKLIDPNFDLYMKVESNYFFTNTPTLPMPNICDYNGDWEEKRSLGPSSIWHPSNDKLAGTENYGDVNSLFCPPIVLPIIKCVDS